MRYRGPARQGTNRSSQEPRSRRRGRSLLFGEQMLSETNYDRGRLALEHLENRRFLSVSAADNPALTAFAQSALAFEPNVGQTDPRVQYLSRGDGYTLFLTDTDAVLRLDQPAPTAADAPAEGNSPVTPQTASESVVDVQLVGANASPTIRPLDVLPGVSNYISADPSESHSNVAHYGQVEYHDIYPGVDLVYYGNQGELEYDFVVAPGADPHAIAFDVRGASGLSLDDQGNLLIHTAAGNVVEHAPVVYQETGEVKTPISGRYVLSGDEVRFEVGSYDHTAPLTIDPILNYSSYVPVTGSAGFQAVADIAVDQQGNVYLTGQTGITSLPPLPGSQTALKSPRALDAYVLKLNPGGQPVYFTYLGGDADANDTAFPTDAGLAIAVDAQGEAVVVGDTFQGNGFIPFPLNTPAQSTPQSGDNAFVTKLTADGTDLVYSTYLNVPRPVEPQMSSQYGPANAVAVDADGNAYVTGDRYATYDLGGGAVSSSSHFFVAKFDPKGKLTFSHDFGGNGFTLVHDIAVDGSGNAYVTGSTDASNFALGALNQPGTIGGIDAFVAKIIPDPATQANPVYAVRFGGTGDDEAAAIAVDSAGDAYSVGTTNSTNFSTWNPLQAKPANAPTTVDTGLPPGGGNQLYEQDTGTEDAFVVKLDPNGVNLIYSTYLGGDLDDGASGVAIDSAGDAFVTGDTMSNNFPLVNPLHLPGGYGDAYGGGFNDAFVSELNPSGSSLIYSTYLGGGGHLYHPNGFFDESTGSDTSVAIAVDSHGNAYIAGNTASSDFPTFNAFDAIQTPAFVAELEHPLVVYADPVSISRNVSFTGRVAHFLAPEFAPDLSKFVVAVNWGDGTTTTGLVSVDPQVPGQFNVLGSHTYASAGAFPVQVTVIDKNVGPEPDVASGEVDVSQSSADEDDTTIAVDPTNPNHLFTASSSSSAGLYAAVSDDGGKTWVPVDSTDGRIADGNDNLPPAFAYPRAIFDKFGNLYLSYIGADLSTVVLLVSYDGGHTYSVIDNSNISGSTSGTPALGIPELSTGPFDNQGNQAVWLVFKQKIKDVVDATEFEATAKDSVSLVTLAGANFLVLPDSGGTRDITSVAVGPAGQVLVALQSPAKDTNGNPLTGVDTISVASLGAGSTAFGSAVTITNTNLAGNQTIPAQNFAGIDSGILLAWDLSNGAYAGRVYAVYTDAISPGNSVTNIFLRYSDNNGATWSAPVAVNDDATSPNELTQPVSHFLPSIAVDPKTGVVAVGWYDTRDDPNQVKTQFYIATSGDGGQTFSPSLLVSNATSDASSQSLSAYARSNQYGAYSGLAIFGGIVHPAWADDSGLLPGPQQFDLVAASMAVASVMPAIPTLTPGTITGVEGSTATGIVAYINDADPTAVADQFQQIQINWGDGSNATSSDPITISQPGGPGTPFALTSSHTYTQAGAYPISVALYDTVSKKIVNMYDDLSSAQSSLSAPTSNETNPTIAVNPRNPQQLFAAWNTDADGGGLYAATSDDGGVTWSPVPAPTHMLADDSDNLPPAYAYPQAVFDGLGNLELAYIGDDRHTSAVVESGDGGKTFPHQDADTVQNGASGSSAAIGITHLAVGPTTDTNSSLWSIFKDNVGEEVDSNVFLVTGNASQGTFAKQPTSDDVPASDGSFSFTPSITIGPKGQALVAFEQRSSTPGLDTLFTSLDGDGLGPNTFGAPRPVLANPDSLLIETHLVGQYTIPAQKNVGVNSGLAVAYDLSNGPHRGRVYLVYTDLSTGPAAQTTNIYLLYSDDDGADWQRVTVSDRPAGASAFMPSLAVDPTSGQVAVGWYDTRADKANNVQAQYFVAISNNGGQSFGPGTVISQSASDATRPVLSPFLPAEEYGYYTALAFYNGLLYPAWADDSASLGSPNPNFDIETERLGTANISDASLKSISPLTVGATAQQTFSGTVATFADSNTFAKAGDFLATVDWGDGTVSSASGTGVAVRADPGGGFDIVGTHVYAKEGLQPYQVKIFVKDLGGDNNTLTGTGSAVAVAPPPQPTASQPQLQEFQNQLFEGTIAVFSVAAEATPGENAPYSYSINWGDGSTVTDSSALLGPKPDATLPIPGSHKYPTAGTYHPVITVTDKRGQTGTATSTIVVAPIVTGSIQATDLGGPLNPATQQFDQQFYLTNTSGSNVPGPLYVEIQGLPAGVTVANASGTIGGDPDIEVDVPGGTLGAGLQVVATLDISDPSLTPFDYTATTYDGPGGITIQDSIQLAATPVTAVAGQLFDGTVATFRAGFPNGDFAASIDWGDGTSSAGTIVGNVNFGVEGTHTYAHAGRYPVSVAVNGPTGAITFSATASGFANVAGSIGYHVTLDTSTLAGTAGFLDLQFNPGGFPDAQPADLTISDFVSSGATLGSTTTAGGGSGTLGGTVDLKNTAVLNDLRQAITFGSQLSFDVQITGDAVAKPSDGLFGSAFALLLLGADGTTPLATVDSGGSALRLLVDSDGSTASEIYPPQVSGTPLATAVVGNDTAVVTDAAPAALGQPLAFTEFAGVSTGEITLATFSLGQNVDLAQDSYTATIDWGDGTATATGTVAISGTTLAVSGSHVYTTGGPLQATVKVSDQLGDTATQTASAQVLGDVTGRVHVESSGLIYNPATGLFVGHVTYTNISNSAISGPVPIVLENLSAGVTLTNATGVTGSDPYVTDVPATVNPGETRDVLIEFSDPSRVPIQYSLAIFDPPPPRYQFGAPVSTAIDLTGGTTTTMRTGDFNGDGKLDVAIFAQTQLEVFLGNGDGTFLPAPGAHVLDGRSDPTVHIVDVEVGDFNNDGKSDLLVVQKYTIEVYLSDGTGRFTLAGTYNIPNQGSAQGFGYATVGDFNRDGNLDVAVATDSPLQLSVIPGDGKGGLAQSPTQLPLKEGSQGFFEPADSVFATDLNGDGKVDIIVDESDHFQVFLGDGNGDFTEAPGSPFKPSLGGGRVIGAADLTGNGQPSLLVEPHESGASFTMIASDGTGRLVQTAFIQDNGYLVGENVAAAFADFNGDGKPDVAELNYNTGNGEGAIQYGVFIALSNGDGTLLVPHADDTLALQNLLALPVIPDAGGAYLAMAAGDFNGDGRPDIVVLQQEAQVPTGPPQNSFYNPLNILVLPTTATTPAAPLSAAATANVTAIEGTPFNGLVSTFTDANPQGKLSDYTATITWGDGTSSAATIAADPNVLGQFDVTGTHTYAEAGYYPVVVSIASQDGATAIVVDQVSAAAVNGQSVYHVSVDTSSLAGQNGQLVLQFNAGGLPGAQDATATVTHFAMTDGSLSASPTLVGGASGNLSGSAALENSGPLNELWQTITYGTRITFDVTLSGPAISQATAGLFGSAFALQFLSANGQTVQLSSDASGAALIAALKGDGTSAAAGLLADNGTGPFAQPQDVFDAPLAATGTSLTASLGSALSGVVANFRDASPLGTASQFSAAIDWGDGTSSAGSIGTNLDGSFAVSGTHTYVAAGSDSVTVTILDVAGATATAVSTAEIAGGSLTASGTTITATAAASFTAAIATFLEANGSGQATFTATVDWGDGISSAGTISANGNSGFSVRGTHTYGREATKSITVVIHGTDGTNATATSQADVADAPLTSAGDSIAATAAIGFTGQVATFSDPDPNGTAADFAATINWGDGTSSAGGIAESAGGGFAVSGMHTYARDGHFNVVVDIDDVGGAVTSATSSAAVTPTASATSTEIEATGVPVVGYEYSSLDGVPVARFAISDGSTTGSYASTIDWGDGTTDTGSVALTGGQYTVSGSHTYHDEGRYTIHMSIVQTSSGGGSGLSTTIAVAALIHEQLLYENTVGTPDQNWIQEIYRDLFGRLAEPQGRDYWVSLLEQGQSRQQVAFEIVRLAFPREFQRDTVDALYAQYLRRAPDQQGDAYWTAFLYDGGTIEEMSQALASSSEYYRLNGADDQGLIEALYHDALGRAPDSAGEAYWQQKMAAGMTQAALAEVIFSSDEYLRLRVNALYEHFLDRPADLDGAEHFAQQLAGGLRDEQIVAQLIASDEYYNIPQI